MIQIDNLETIKYLKDTLNRLEQYGSFTQYQNRLQNIIEEYDKKSEKEENGLILETENKELELFQKLEQLKFDLTIPILFLKWMDLTEDWELEVDLSSFDTIENKLAELLTLFPKIEKQEKYLQKYYDLLLKKIIQEYLNGNETYLIPYSNLKERPYLVHSIESFLKSKNLSLESKIENYDLETILDKIFEKETVVEIEKTEKISILKRVRFELSKLKNYENISEEDPLAYLGNAKERVIEIIGEEKALKKDFRNHRFDYIDLSDVDFTDVWIKKCVFIRTGAKIDPQKIRYKDMSFCDIENENLFDKDFTGVKLDNAALHYTGAFLDLSKDDKTCLQILQRSDHFSGVFLKTSEKYKKHAENCINFVYVESDPRERLSYLGTKKWELYQKLGAKTIYEKDFSDVRFNRMDLSDVDFTDVKINGADISYTKANVDPQKIRDKNMQFCIAEGINLMDKDFTGVHISYANLDYTGAYIKRAQDTYSLFWTRASVKGCFTTEQMKGAIYVEKDPKEKLEYLGNAKWILYDYLRKYTPKGFIEGIRLSEWYECLLKKDFQGVKIENIDLSNVDFTEVLLDYKTSLKNTNAHITKEQANRLYPKETWNEDYTFLEDLGIHLKEVSKLVKK